MPFSPQSIEHTEARINTMRLQAAAPELLEALAAVVRADTYMHERGEALAQARKAIAKATGE